MQDELFQKLNKATLLAEDGTPFSEFRKTLTPKWEIVWLHISLAWLFLLACIVLIISFSGKSLAGDIALAVVGSVLVGYTINYFILFFHEASHFNIHPDKKLNDILCNIFLGGIVGQEIKNYRPIHWDHHRHLGTPEDTEVTYFSPLNVSFLFKTLFGIRALEVILQRKQKLQSKQESELHNEFNSERQAAEGTTTKTTAPYTLLGGAVVNGSFVCLLLYFHQWPMIFAWLVGIACWFPFFSALRQLLEHRDINANPTANYLQSDHGQIHRLFGDGIFASTFGAAGFNRHLLHHWEPQISYTRLRDLEKYLMQTQAADYLQQNSTSYARTFQQLFQAQEK